MKLSHGKEEGCLQSCRGKQVAIDEEKGLSGFYRQAALGTLWCFEEIDQDGMLRQLDMQRRSELRPLFICTQ